MKKIRLIVLTIALIVAMIPCSAFAASNQINVTIDGVTVQWTDAVPYVDSNNRTMVPLRAIGEAMHLVVEWDNSIKTAIFASGYEEKYAVEGEAVIDTNNDGKMDAFLGLAAIGFALNQKQAVTILEFYKFGSDLDTADSVYTDKDSIMMDTEAVSKDNRTYAPVKYLAEFYGYTVKWEPKTKTVALTSKTE